MNRIMLLSGKAQNGKDSTANIMIKYLSGKSLIIHNADYLKHIAKDYMGWDGSKDEKSRTMLQQLGTEKTKIKLNKPFFWIEQTCNIIEMLSDYFDWFLVPDTRFKSEIYYPKARFGDKVTTIRVERIDFESPLTLEQQKHSSETELDMFPHDVYIASHSGLDILESKILSTFDFDKMPY